MNDQNRMSGANTQWQARYEHKEGNALQTSHPPPNNPILYLCEGSRARSIAHSMRANVAVDN